MTSLTPSHTPGAASCHLKAARRAHTPRLLLLAALACAMLLATACKRSEPPQAQKPAATQKTKADTAQQADPEKSAQDREAFGLPLPPDAAYIFRTKAYVTAYSDMKIHEIEAFYKSRLVDYEYIFPGYDANTAKRPPRELHIVGLRAYMPQIHIRHTGGKHGKATLNFRPALEPPKSQDQNQELANKSPDEPANNNAQQRRREKGMPVLDRNANGELIAPGARWGEPYTPPEGTPLHTKRNKDNFGQPYGQWQMP